MPAWIEILIKIKSILVKYTNKYLPTIAETPKDTIFKKALDFLVFLIVELDIQSFS